jgi:hypothetical protein
MIQVVINSFGNGAVLSLSAVALAIRRRDPSDARNRLSWRYRHDNINEFPSRIGSVGLGR